MSISFECPDCAKKYKVDDKLAGKRATCKGCGTSMQIPGGEPAAGNVSYRGPSTGTDDSFQQEPVDFDSLVARAQTESPSRPPPARPAVSATAPRSAAAACPECGSDMIQGQRVCVKCGYDIRNGKQIRTHVETADASAIGGRNAYADRHRRGDGGKRPGLARVGLALTLIGIAANLLPLAGHQLKYLMALGASAPTVGAGVGLLGAVLFFLSGNPGAGVFSGGGVLAAFAICMAMDPYGKFAAAEHAAGLAAKAQLSAGSPSGSSEAMQKWQADADARREAARQREAAVTAQQELQAQRMREAAVSREAQAMASGAPSTLVPTYIPPPPPRVIPTDPVDRDLFFLQSGARLERIGAGTHLLSAPPKERIDEVATAFRALVTEQDVALRRLSIPGMLLVGSDANVPALITLVGDPNGEIRTAAIKVLGQMQDERALEPLLGRIAVDTDEAIAAVRPFADRVEPPLLAKLKDVTDKDLKLSAIKGLLVYGTPASVPALRAAAKDAELSVATAAKAAWRKIAPNELDPITEAMIDLETDHSADAALTRLAAMRPDESKVETVTAALSSLLASARPVDIGRLAAAMVTWQGADAVPALLPTLAAAQPPEARQKVAQALVKTGDSRVADALVGWLTSGSDKINAPILLASMGPSAEDAVLGILFVEDATLPPVTISLLEKVGGTKSVRPLRMFAAKAQNVALRRQAEVAAGTIEKRLQVELRTQRLRPATAPAAKK